MNMAQGGRGPFASFDEEQLYREIFRACLSGLNDEEKCHELTQGVMESVGQWLEGRENVKEWQVRDRIIEELEDLGAGIAYFYEYNSYVEPGE